MSELVPRHTFQPRDPTDTEPTFAHPTDQAPEATRALPPPPRVVHDHMTDVQAIWRSLMRSADNNPAQALAEAALWIGEARELLRQASPHLDPIFQAQIRELLARKSCGRS